MPRAIRIDFLETSCFLMLELASAFILLRVLLEAPLEYDEAASFGFDVGGLLL